MFGQGYLAERNFFWELWFSMKFAFQIWPWGPGWIHVRTNLAYRPEGQGTFRTKMPKFRKFCPDKNGGFREILGSNIYGDYPGSSPGSGFKADK
jgi:hypothetical protein